MMVLQADLVEAREIEERGAFALGFAEDDDDGVAMYIERVGDRHRMVIGEAAHEGGVEASQLAQGWLKLTLTRDAAVALQLDTVLVIQFPIDSTPLVRDALARILAPVSG